MLLNKKLYLLIFLLIPPLLVGQYEVGDTITTNLTAPNCGNECSEGDDLLDYFAMEGSDVGVNRVTWFVFSASW